MDGLLSLLSGEARMMAREMKRDGKNKKKNISKFILKSKNPSIQFRTLMAFYLGGLLIMDDIIVIIN